MSSQAGIFYFDQRPVLESVQETLVRSCRTKHADASREYREPGLFMAHAATWIDDLSTLERQPWTSPSGSTVTFDGRLDNREDLLLRLRSHLKEESTDCAVAQTALEAWGDEGLVHLVGDWSMASWDPAGRAVLLASDFAGTRPLYFHANDQRVVWSSDLGSLVSLTGINELDEQFVAGFLLGCGSPNRTIWRGILPVPAGKALRFGQRGVDTNTFWELPVHGRIRYHAEREYDEHLRSLFRESVRARLRTSYPVCSELSGGWDSSSIVCMAQDLIATRKAEAAKLVSFSFGPLDSPDQKFYTAVRKSCGIEGVYLNTDDYPFIDPAFLEEASPAIWSRLSHEIASRAKQLDARVYFTGQAGDLMMGNWIDDSEQLAAHLHRGQWKTAFTESVAWSKATRVPAPVLLWRGLLASLPSGWRIESRYPVDPSTPIPERYGDSLTRSLKSAADMEDPDWIWCQRWKEAPAERRKHFRCISGLLESRFFRPPERLQHLYYTFPYADRPLLEFLLTIPADILAKPGEPRALMRRAFREFLPSEVARRRSKASYTGEFLKSLRRAVSKLLVERGPLLVEELGYVDAAALRARLQRMTQSLPCNETQLRQVLLLEFWLRSQKARAGEIVDAAPALAVAI